MLEGRYVLFYRDIKYPRIEVSRDVIKVVLPKGGGFDVERIIEERKDWIERKVKSLRELEEIADGLILYNRDDLGGLVDGYVKEFSEVLGVKPNEVSFRRMKVRWGSCDLRRGRLIFNRDLNFLPDDLIRYVVLHEMCHLIEGNHGKRFWRLVEGLDRNYREKERLLAGYRIKLENKK
jgi:predicted metal-dependent hydrolase